ncbi:3-deoxy-8-phosphooctulonate synthase [Candidatus Omnitrophota bacterium]
MVKEVKAGNVAIGADNPLVLVAGPCVIESESSALRHAKILQEITGEFSIPLIYKSSYDKANRTSLNSFRGPGARKGLKILKRIRSTFGIPVLSDVHCKCEIPEAKKVLDVIQIPAFLSRQTDLIIEAAKTGRTINIKKGQFMSPWEMKYAVAKARKAKNSNIILTERGSCFGYNNLVSDFRSVLVMRSFGYPVVYDATHSVQIPAGQGDRSGGDREFIPHLSMAACACGVDGIFLEVHERPDRALCDGPNSLNIAELRSLLLRLKEINRIAKMRVF